MSFLETYAQLVRSIIREKKGSYQEFANCEINSDPQHFICVTPAIEGMQTDITIALYEGDAGVLVYDEKCLACVSVGKVAYGVGFESELRTVLNDIERCLKIFGCKRGIVILDVLFACGLVVEKFDISTFISRLPADMPGYESRYAGCNEFPAD